MNPARANSLPFSGLACPTCGYNLTGLPRSVCPECGNPFDPVKLALGHDRLLPKSYGYAGLLLSLVFGAWVMWRSYSAAEYCVSFTGRCGTGSMMAATWLVFVYPLGLIPVLVGSHWAKRSGVCLTPTRYCRLVAVTVWLTSTVIVWLF